MLSRIAARILTGPFAFFVAGAIDITVFLATDLRRRISRRLRARDRAWREKIADPG